MVHIFHKIERNIEYKSLTQHHIPKGLNVMGGNWVGTVTKDIKQIHECAVLKLRHASNIS